MIQGQTKVFILDRIEIESGEVVEISVVSSENSDDAACHGSYQMARLFNNANFIFKMEEIEGENVDESTILKLSRQLEAFKESSTLNNYSYLSSESSGTSMGEDKVKFNNHMFIKLDKKNTK